LADADLDGAGVLSGAFGLGRAASPRALAFASAKSLQVTGSLDRGLTWLGVGVQSPPPFSCF
jgi:hypothetical protein